MTEKEPPQHAFNVHFTEEGPRIGEKALGPWMTLQVSLFHASLGYFLNQDAKETVGRWIKQEGGMTVEQR